MESLYDELFSELQKLKDSNADDDSVINKIEKLAGEDSTVEIKELMLAVVQGISHEELLKRALIDLWIENTMKHGTSTVKKLRQILYTKRWIPREVLGSSYSIKFKFRERGESSRSSSETRKRPRVVVDAGANELPEKMINKIRELGGYNVRLVLRKVLENSDILGGQNRLLIPRKSSNLDFLKEEEIKKMDLYKKDKDSKYDLRVLLIEPCGESVCELRLRNWSNGSSTQYSLTSGSGWTSMVERNGVEAGNVVELWTFRRLEEELCFALVVLEQKTRKGKEVQSCGGTY